MAIYEATSTSVSRRNALAAASNPPPGVAFQPVPYKLLNVALSGGREVAATGYGEYSGQFFDPWKKGDFVAVECRHSYFEQGKGTVRYSTWHVGRRASTPAANTLKVDVGAGESARVISVKTPDLWRIPYRYLHTAAALLGQEFKTREALEAALDGQPVAAGEEASPPTI
jgi:hypothetical protein